MIVKLLRTRLALRRLRAASFREREEAVHELDRLGWQAKSPADRARAALARGDWEACVSLGEVAIGPLMAMLWDVQVSDQAAEALAKIGTPAACELVDDLDSLSEKRSKRAAEVLARMGATAVGALVDLVMADSRERFRHRVAGMALTDQRGRGMALAMAQAEERGIALAVPLLVSSGQPAVRPLLEALELLESGCNPLESRRDHYARARIAQAIGEIGDRGAADALLRALGHWSRRYTERPALELCYSGLDSISLADELTEFMDLVDVCGSVADALRHLKIRQAAGSIASLLEHVHEHRVGYLALHDAERERNDCVRLVYEVQTQLMCRLIRALGALGDVTCAAAIEPLRGHHAPEVRECAEEALAALGRK